MIMKRSYLMVILVALALIATSSNVFAFQFTDNFDNNTYAGVWAVDQALTGPPWQGWSEESGMLLNGPNGGYNKTATVIDAIPAAGSYGVKVRKAGWGADSRAGVIFGGDLTTSMFNATIGGSDADGWSLMVQQWASSDGGSTWSHVGGWNTAAITKPVDNTWYDLELSVTDTSATATVGSVSKSLALSGLPGGKTGLVNNVSWVDFDDFHGETVPEPMSLVLLGSGLVGLFVSKKKK